MGRMEGLEVGSSTHTFKSYNQNAAGKFLDRKYGFDGVFVGSIVGFVSHITQNSVIIDK